MKHWFMLGILSLMGADVGSTAPERITLEAHGGTIEVMLPGGLTNPHRAELLDWVRGSAHAVGAWYGGFPVPSLRLDVRSIDGTRIGGGTTWPGDPPRIAISVGRAARAGHFDRDWVLVHEMTHTAFPSVPRQHHWLEEGLATYLEPWARVAVGQLPPEVAWYEFARDLPQGLPRPGDQGLDQTSSWASTYWGGALYCLLVDLEIRERTGNRAGLREAVSAIARAGGLSKGGVQSLESVLAIGDAAVGVPAMTETWKQMRDKPISVDLVAIWHDLGVIQEKGTVRFNDSAPKAEIRKAIAPAPR